MTLNMQIYIETTLLISQFWLIEVYLDYIAINMFKYITLGNANDK